MYNHIRAVKAKWGFCPETENTTDQNEGYSRFLAELVRCSKPEAECSKCMRNRLEHGHYETTLRLWFSRFKRKQFFVLSSDALDGTKKSKQDIRAALLALGSFLGIKDGDEQWAGLINSGPLRVHTAEGYRGESKAKLEHLRVDECQAAAVLYKSWNEDLYRLMHSSKSEAPVRQPAFEKFPEPCHKRDTR